MWPFKRDKLEFINEIPGVAEFMPLVPAHQIKRQWVQKGLAQFAEQRKDPTWNHQRHVHVARCPGMFTLHRHGWVLRTWQDIVITTNGDGSSFQWRSSSSAGGDAMGFHPPEQLSDLFESWPTNTLRTVLKFNTGWRCVVPKGYYLYELPLQFNEDPRFTTIAGFYSRKTGPASMNVQVLWHLLEGETLIKAGTPIAQYFLVPIDQPEMSCRTVRPSDPIAMHSTYISSRFTTDYRDMKRVFGGDDEKS